MKSLLAGFLALGSIVAIAPAAERRELHVEISESSIVRLDGHVVSVKALGKKLQETAKENKDTPVSIIASFKARREVVEQIINLCEKNGLLRVRFEGK